MLIHRWTRFLLAVALAAFVAGCGVWEPMEVDKPGEEELEGPGLFTGKEGGLVIYQR